MTHRFSGGCTIILTGLLLSGAALAQAPPPLYTGSVGGGFAVTGGNTSTQNFNLSGDFVRDPQSRNLIKGTASYLRGNQNSILNLDRTGINLRDEYTVSGRAFVFGQIDYLRDQFKGIIFLWAPTAGVGHRIIDTDSTQFLLSGGAGGVLEKNPGIVAQKSGSLTAGQSFQQSLFTTATFTQSISSLWKTNDFSDSLTNFSLGLTTTLVGRLELKLEFIDSYKNKPSNVALKKNDTAFVTTFVVKF